MKKRLQLRAENYTYKDLMQMLPTTTTKTIQKALYNARYPIVFLGDKGSGKTLTAMQVMYYIIHHSKRHLPVMCIFKRNEEFEILEPKHIADELQWGKKRLKMYELSPEELLNNADTVIFDDFHYMCEYVIDGKIPIEYLLDAVNAVLRVVKNKKTKCMLISENQLRYYAEIFEDSRFDQILPYFGEVRQNYTNLVDWKKAKSIAYPRQVINQEYNIYDMISILRDSGCNIDNMTYDWLRINSYCNPRVVIAFIKAFKRKTEIGFDNVIRKAVKRLRRESNKEMLTMLKTCPVLLPTSRAINVMRMVNKFASVKLARDYIDLIESQRQVLCDAAKYMQWAMEDDRTWKKCYHPTFASTDCNPDDPPSLLKLFGQLDVLVKLMDSAGLRLEVINKGLHSEGEIFGKAVSNLMTLNKKFAKFGLATEIHLMGWKVNYWGEYKDFTKLDEHMAYHIWQAIKENMYLTTDNGLLLNGPLVVAFKDELYAGVYHYDEELITQEEFDKEFGSLLRKQSPDGTKVID